MVVRIGPRCVSFVSATAQKQIYNSPDFIKSPSYELFLLPGQPHNLITTPSTELHSYLRRVMSPAFGNQYLQRLEPLFAQILQSLFKKIDSDFVGHEDVTVDIWKLCQAYVFDLIGSTAFGKPFNLIENSNHPIVTDINRVSEFMLLRTIVPPILFSYIPIYKRGIVTP